MLVLGGRGFIGRHAVAALAERGIAHVIGGRQSGPNGPIRVETLLAPDDWLPLLEGFDAVLNCVGILRPVGTATYERVHHLAPAALAAACAMRSVRLVHVSAMGLHAEAGSRFITSKLAGERAIREAGGDWIIARPSLIDGDGGFGARWLRGLARSPVFFAPLTAQGRIAAVWASEVGEALTELCAGEPALAESRCFELGGPESYTFADYVRGLGQREAGRRPIAAPIPGWSARLAAHICDLLRFSPFSFGHYELLCRDNVPQPNRLSELLGRDAARVLSPSHLRE